MDEDSPSTIKVLVLCALVIVAIVALDVWHAHGSAHVSGWWSEPGHWPPIIPP